MNHRCWCWILVLLVLQPGSRLDQLHHDQEVSSWGFFLRSFLHTQASQRAPVIPRRKPSDVQVRYEGSGNVCPKILWLFRGFLFFSFNSLSNLRNANPFTFVGYLFIGFPVFRFFPDGMGLWLLRYGQTWDLACYATVLRKAWRSRFCEILRVTPRFRGSVAVVVLWDLACYATIQGKTWLLCPDSWAGEHVLSTAVGRVSSPPDNKPGRPYAPCRNLASRMACSRTSRIFLLLFFCYHESAHHAWSRRRIYPKQYFSLTDIEANFGKYNSLGHNYPV